jgi:hypothetical protein
MTSPETDPAIPEVSPGQFAQEPVSQEPAARTGIPWEDPELSRPTALGRTLKAVLWQPGKFFRAVPRGGWSEALAFGLLLGTTGFAASLFWNLLSHLGAGRPLGLFALLQFRSLGHGGIIILMALSPAVVLANLGLSSLCLWGAVSLQGVTGPEKFLRVWRIFNYAQAGMAAALIPFLGGPAGSLWVLYLTYKGIREVFAMSGGRAAGVLGLSVLFQAMLLGLLMLGAIGLPRLLLR